MKQIIIAQRGWVFVGLVRRTKDEVVIDDAKCIRVWGTTRGLGQLALEGPLPETVLDEMGTVRMHPLTIVAAIDCAEGPWALL